MAATPSPSPSPSLSLSPLSQPPLLPLTPSYTTTTHHTNNHQPPPSPPSKSPINFSPPLIAMVIVATIAFLFITYSRLISRHLSPPFLRLLRRRRHHNHHHFHFPSPPPPPPFESPYGLDDAVIKTIPITIYNIGFLEFDDCAVCLLEFEQGECIRTLPRCCHSFHVECIDMWLKSHATCPLCRADVYLSPQIFETALIHPPPPMSPLMAGRVRPSFDEGILLEGVFSVPSPSPLSPEIVIQSDHHQCRNFLLKRSYSFGFERSFESGAATTPFHHHHHRQRNRFFWSSKRPSSTPFSSLAKSRVFSFRRTLKSSPNFFRRRGFFPVCESSGSFTVGSSRRVMMKPLSSPLFGRVGVFSSSRMRMGDPEALISPERYNRR